MADMDYNYNGEDVVSGVEPVKKRKGAVIGGLTAGVLVVAVGGGVAAYNFSDLVKNQVKLRISKPDNYYTWVTEKNSNEFASQLANCYRTYLEEQKNGTTSDVSLNFNLSDEAKELLSSDDEDFPNIDNVKLGITSKTKNNVVNGDVRAEVNGKSIMTVDMAVDYAAMDIFFRLPGLSEQWIVSPSAFDEEDVQSELCDMESIITPEELESLIAKYTNIYNSYISDIEIEKKEEVAIGDINVNYTVAEMTITDEKADEIAEGFLNSFKEDELLKEIFVERTKAMTAEEYVEEINNGLEELKENDESSAAMIVKTYIDAKGCIRGISAVEDEENGDEMRLILGMLETEIRGEAYASTEGEEDFRADISLSEKDKVSYDGNITFNVDGETIIAELSDIVVENKDKGFMSGTLKVTADVQNADDEKEFYINLSTDGKSQEFSTDIVVDDVNYGNLSIAFSTESGAETSVPDKSGAYDLNGEDADFPTDYVDQDKMTSYAKDVLLNLGLKEETADELAQEFAESIYYTYEDDWYYEEDINGWDETDSELTTLDPEDEDLYWQDSDYEDPYEEDIVYAEDGHAYVMVMDKSGIATYMGYNETLSYGAENAEIKGSGTYTISVSADTEGYKYMASDIMPDGFSMLGFEAYGVENVENAEIIVKSVKVDGKEIKLTAEPYLEATDDYFSVLLYLDEEYFAFDEVENCLDASSVSEWTNIEITFEIKGL